MGRRLAAAAATAAALLGTLAACGGSRGTHELTVFAAASLADALPRTDGVRYSFAGSQQLAAQLGQGAEADVLITADERTIRAVTADYRAVATTTLAIAVAQGNPKGIASLADLARVTVVLADPSVPIGRYSADALQKAGVTVQPRSLELDVEAAVQKVAIGEADATIAYAATRRAELIAIPPEHNVVARYYAAALTDDGRGYVERLPGLLQRHGFGPP